MSLIDTYQIATIGQNLANTFTLASNGILIDIIIEDIITPPTGKPGGKAGQGSQTGKHEEEKKKKKITVIATIEGVEYKEVKVYEGKKDITVKDIKVDITENMNKPKISIKILND